MNKDLIKANLNLYAVLKNLEDLVACDKEMKNLARDWDISIQFSVRKGPRVCVSFRDGACTVERGKCRKPTVRLFFTSPAHLNRMFDGKGNPIPLKGFSRLGFLTKDFPKLTDRLAYYLKPDDALLKNKKYLEMNTRMTLNIAAFALRELAAYDPPSREIASHLGDTFIEMKVLPKGPAVNIRITDGAIEPSKGEAERPMAVMHMKDMKVANDFLNGKSDSFAALALGDVIIRGQIHYIEAITPIFDRIPLYLS